MERIRCDIRQAGEDDLQGLRQFRGIAKNGQIRWIEINAVRLEWDGRPAALVFIDDVTSRKDSERALVESEKRYRLLAENVSDVIWVTDLDLHPTFISPSIKGLVGSSGSREPMLNRLEDASGATEPAEPANPTPGELLVRIMNSSDGVGGTWELVK